MRCTPFPIRSQSFHKKTPKVTFPGTPKTTQITKRRYKTASKNHLEKNTRKSTETKPVLAMEREARLLFVVGPNKKGNEQRTERKRDKDRQRDRQRKEQHPRSAFPLEGTILNPGSLFLVFSMCFTRVFFRNTRFVREWGQRHLKKSKKGPPNHFKNDPGTTPRTSKKQCRKKGP